MVFMLRDDMSSEVSKHEINVKHVFFCLYISFEKFVILIIFCESQAFLHIFLMDSDEWI